MHPPACRLTVEGPARRVDVVVPASTPVAELLPGVVALGVGGASGEDEVRPWRLTRAVGPDLEPHRTLHESGVRDGDVLLLRHETAPALGLLRSDPVVAVADIVDALPGRWDARRRSVLGLALLVPLLVALLVAADLATAPVTTAVLAAVTVAVLLGAAGLSVGEGATATALVVLAALPAAALGRAVGDGLGAGPPAQLGWAAGAVLAVLALAAGVVPARRVCLGAGAVALVALAAAAGAVVASPAAAAAVGLVALVAAAPQLPRLALRAVGLVRSGTGTTSVGGPRALAGAPASERALGARTVVAAALVAQVPLVGVLAAVAALDGGVCGRWLAAAAGVALLLRARASLLTAEVAALADAGALAVAAGTGAYVLAALDGGRPVEAVLPPALLALAALLLALPATRAAVAAPGTDRRLRQLEGVALLSLVPLALGVLGLFGAVVHAASGLR